MQYMYMYMYLGDSAFRNKNKRNPSPILPASQAQNSSLHFGHIDQLVYVTGVVWGSTGISMINISIYKKAYMIRKGFLEVQ